MHRVSLQFVDQDKFWRRGFSDLSSCENLSDVTFVLRNGKVFGHKMILQEIISEYLKDYFCSKCKDDDIVILMPDFNVESIEYAIHEAYIKKNIDKFVDLFQGTKPLPVQKRQLSYRTSTRSTRKNRSREERKHPKQLRSNRRKSSDKYGEHSNSTFKSMFPPTKRRKYEKRYKSIESYPNTDTGYTNKTLLNKELIKLKNALTDIDVTLGPTVETPTEKENLVAPPNPTKHKDRKASEIETQLGPGISVTKTPIPVNSKHETIEELESIEDKGDDIVVEGSDYSYAEVKEVQNENHEQESVGEMEFLEEKGDDIDIVVEGSDVSLDEERESQSENEKSLIDSILEDTNDESYYSENCKIVSKVPKVTYYKKKKIRNFACDMCDFKATEQKGIQRHKECKHEEKYKCLECGYKAYNTTHLKEHKLVKHEGVTFSCNKCSFIARQKSYLKKHKITKHGL